MIYVSSSCIKASTIKEAVTHLAQNGYKNIELSGGTKYYDGFLSDLLELKEQFGLNYLCHNYFPPPPKDFVLNLASLNTDMSENSFRHILNAIEVSEKISGDKYAFHAGFLIDVDVDEVGKVVKKKDLFDREEAKNKFRTKYEQIITKSKKVKIYIENNVISKSNFENYKGQNPCFITDIDGYKEFKEIIDFNLLLDIAHIKVSAKTLNLNFEEQLFELSGKTDYLHISDNDGLHDNNLPLRKDSELYNILRGINLSEKTITLEVYSQISEINKSYELIHGLI